MVDEIIFENHPVKQVAESAWHPMFYPFYKPLNFLKKINKIISEKDKGIYDKGDQKTQYVKLMEEAGEVGRAILKDDLPEIKDGIGDMVVVLTNLAELSGLTIEECIESAYDTIAKRKGKMINGTFVKNN